MFEIETTAVIGKVTVSAKDEDGVLSRRVKIRLDREFDDEIAAQIGSEAVRALKGLANGGLAKVTMPIDGIHATLELRGASGDKAKVALATGVKAVAKGPRDDDSPPSVQLEFEFLFQDNVWAFLGRNIGGMATLSIHTVQLDLPKTAAPKEKASESDARQLQNGIAGHTGSRRKGASDRADEQGATSPEEAEELRNGRLGAEALARFGAAVAGLKLKVKVSPAAGTEPVVYVARLETPRWVAEGEGDTEDEARGALAEKVVDKLEADAGEIRKLAAEQAKDEAKDKPRRGLQVPKKGPRPTKRGATRTPHEEAPPSDDDGPLAF